MTSSDPVSSDLLREVIREVVREVDREVVAEEVAAVGGASVTAAVRRPGASSARTSGGTGTRMERGALTERHVRAAGLSATIMIGRSVVVTPLARERAKSMGVEIIRVED